MKAPSPVYLIAGGAVAVALLWAWRSGGVGGLGKSLGAGAVDLADGVVTGTVTTIGEAVGIPKTNLTECERAKLEGRTWDASFACPAGDFLAYLWK